MSAPGPRLLSWGTIPERQYLNIVCRLEGMPTGVTSVDELERELRRLRDAGRWSDLRAVLLRLGIDWKDPLAATVVQQRKAALS